MVLPQDKPDDSCGGCAGCGVPSRRAELRGWRAGLAAAGVFLLPPAMALAAALLVGGGQGRRFAATVCGLLFGLALAAVGARVFYGGPKEPS